LKKIYIYIDTNNVQSNLSTGASLKKYQSNYHHKLLATIHREMQILFAFHVKIFPSDMGPRLANGISFCILHCTMEKCDRQSEHATTTSVAISGVTCSDNNTLDVFQLK